MSGLSDYIPSELIRNIIARLPVDDVLRCTSVCKSWYSLINSPSFTTLHLNLSSANQEPRLLVRYCPEEVISYRVCRYRETFGEIGELDPPFQREWIMIGCVDGLVCLCDMHDNTIALWNPSLKKSVIVSKARDLSGRETIGFGFVPTSYEWKLVKFSLDHFDDDECEAEVYDLGTGSWRNLKLGVSWHAFVETSQAYLKGIIHWQACDMENVPPANFILTFDLINEKIGALPVPSCFRHGHMYVKPSTFRESLWLVDDTTSSYGFCEIWIMKEYGVTDSWEKIFNINRKQHDLREFLYFSDNGELLFSKLRICDEDEDEDVYDDEFCDKIELVSYNCNDNQVKNLGVLGSFRCALYTYTDSLVWRKRRNKAFEKGSSSAERTILPLVKEKVNVAEKNMDRYQKAEKPRAETPINENEIRVTSQGRMTSYITYAMSLLEKNGSQEVVFKAMGSDIDKTITIVELIKRKVFGLRQITSTGLIDVTDTSEPLEEGKYLLLETTRHVSMITITLSLKELDSSSLQYQPPLPADQVRAATDFDYEEEGLLIGHGRGRGDRGRGRPKAPNEDGNWNGPARAFNRGRGRGYRGAYNQVDAPHRYYDNQDAPPVHTRGRGRGRGNRGGGRGRGFRINVQVHQPFAAESSSGSSCFW